MSSLKTNFRVRWTFFNWFWSVKVFLKFVYPTTDHPPNLAQLGSDKEASWYLLVQYLCLSVWRLSFLHQCLPVMTYGSERWLLTMDLRVIWQAMERDMLGVIKNKEMRWQTRFNDTDPRITKLKWLKWWAGHIACRTNERRGPKELEWRPCTDKCSVGLTTLRELREDAGYEWRRPV